MNSKKLNIFGVVCVFFTLGAFLFYRHNHIYFGNKYAKEDFLTFVISVQVISMMVAAIVFFRRGLWHYVKKFFSEKSHPINLAVIRIVVFGVLFQLDLKSLGIFHLFPEELLVAPPGLEWVPISYLQKFPLEVYLVPVYRCFCLMAMMGLFTRYSVASATLLTFYLHGLQQFFRVKIYSQHLFWIALILCVSQCAHALSVDLWLKNRKRKAQGKTPFIPKPSVKYTTPIRMAWLLIGFVFFSGGIFKWYPSGITWIFSDNLNYHIYWRWHLFPAFEPLFRVDLYPFLCMLCALMVVFFEVFFWFFLIFPMTRIWAIGVALLFGLAMIFIMNINLWTLHLCFLIFPNWAKILKIKRKKISIQSAGMTIKKAGQPLAVWFMAALVFAGNFAALTLTKTQYNWPFSPIATFHHISKSDYVNELVSEVKLINGDTVSHYDLSPSENFQKSRLWGIGVNIINTKGSTPKAEKLNKLWLFYLQHDPKLVHQVREITFYKDHLSKKPEKWDDPPVKREKLYYWKNGNLD